MVYSIARLIQAISAIMALNFDIKLIPEFDGTEDNVADWISKVEMVCSLQTPGPQQENVIPLRLKGGALSVRGSKPGHRQQLGRRLPCYKIGFDRKRV